MKKILVVVDMQNDFIDGPLGTPEARAIVDNVCAKIRDGEWDWIIRTMDTHGDVTYFYTQEGRKLHIGHCFTNTHGWCSNEDVRNAIQSTVYDSNNMDDHLETSIIRKNTFGSTALVDKINTMLRTRKFSAELEKDIELTLIGVCTDICVISNALLLKAHYPEMKIVVDAACCAGTTPEKHRMALEVMKSCQVDVENMPEDLPDNYIVRNFVVAEDNVPFNQVECDRQYNISCAADTNCKDYCTMRCPYEKRGE